MSDLLEWFISFSSIIPTMVVFWQKVKESNSYVVYEGGYFRMSLYTLEYFPKN